jgi:hypothetical protein
MLKYSYSVISVCRKTLKILDYSFATGMDVFLSSEMIMHFINKQYYLTEGNNCAALNPSAWSNHVSIRPPRREMVRGNLAPVRSSETNASWASAAAKLSL